MDQIKKFKDPLEIISNSFLSTSYNRITLIHHNDTDGLSAGSILTSCFERMNTPLHRYAIEVLHPLSLKALFDQEDPSENDLMVFTDLGSGSLKQISSLNKNNASILVIDHHNAEDSIEDIQLINCTQFGLEGSYASASTHAYLFAKACDQWNTDLAWLGALGAYGDGFLNADQKLFGLNVQVAQQAVELNQIEPELRVSGYSFFDLKKWTDLAGSYGFHSGGVDIAVKTLREEPSMSCFESYIECIKPFDQLKNKLDLIFSQIELKESLDKKRINFILPDDFKQAGSKSVGLLCQRVFDADPSLELVLGAQPVHSAVPGLGNVFSDYMKISFRARNIDLRSLLPEKLKNLDLYADVIHPHAASSLVPTSKISELIESICE